MHETAQAGATFPLCYAYQHGIEWGRGQARSSCNGRSTYMVCVGSERSGCNATSTEKVSPGERSTSSEYTSTPSKDFEAIMSREIISASFHTTFF